MHARRRTGLLVAVLVAAGVLAPSTAGAESRRGQLRGGLSAIADGDPVGGLIETRTVAGQRQIAVSVQLDAVPDAAVRVGLGGAGLAIRSTWGTTVDGFVDPARLRALAAVPSVRSVFPIRHGLGSRFIGPAPALHGATAWQQAGYLGSGVKVGILDGGFDGFDGLMGSELPATVQARCYGSIGAPTTTLSDCVTPGERHGTAVAEAVMDMAPGASLYVSNATAPADLAATVSWMTAAGVRVINFSQASGILLEGMGDGTTPYHDMTYALVDQAVAGGALFVVSSGNAGETSWMGAPTDADGDGWVDFAPGDEANYVDLEADQEIAVAIRWASPATDYDLSIWQGDDQLAESADAQSTTGDPLEIVDFVAPTAGQYEISVWRDGGPVAPTLRMLLWSDQAARLSYRTTAGSLPAPADSANPGLVTVGAVDYRSPTVAEPYSSRGPTLDGRIKPDIVAADCAPTVSLLVFCGTSEAAPIVSGAAALILEADPTLTPPALAAYLRSHATPLGSPVPNNDTGYGALALGAPANLPASLAFLAPAASGSVGSPFLGQPVVGILDSAGHLVTRGAGAGLPVSLSIATNAGTGSLACPAGLTGTAVAGVVRFAGCAIDKPGSGYTLRADAPGLAGVAGAPFAVTPAGSPATLTVTGSTSTVRYGLSLGLTGQAALPGGASVAIDAVRLEGGVETDIRPATTDASGIATWSFKPIVTSDYRLRSVASGTALVEVSAPVHVTVDATAVLGSSIPDGRTIGRSTSIALTTTIRPIGNPAARGRARIEVFQRTSSGWTRRRTVYANADATGRARATIRLPSAGSWWIRSRAEPTITNGASAWTTGVKYTVR